MLNVDPWANRLATGPDVGLSTLPLLIDPSQSVFIGGRDELAAAGACSVYFGGTDVTGPLHLGHLYCFAAGKSMAEQRAGRFVVSINEIESGLSRDVPARSAFQNAETIQECLQRCGISVHSRLRDAELVYASCCLFRWLQRKNHTLVGDVYGDIEQSDLLAICPMILTPAFLGHGPNTSVCAIYGYDEVKHVEFIYRLYRDDEFLRWATENCANPIPSFTYVLTPLVAGNDPRFKMSKSRQHDAIAWDCAPNLDAPHADMFSRLYEFATSCAPHLAVSPLGRAVGRHAGRNHALL